MQEKRKLLNSASNQGLGQTAYGSRIPKNKSMNLSTNRSQHYTPNITQDKPRNNLKKKFGSGSPQFSFGSAERVKNSIVDYMNNSTVVPSSRIKNIPGPGDYNPHPEAIMKRTSSAWSIAGKTGFNKLGENAKNPGPGAYNAKEKSNLPFYRFGSAKKEFIYEQVLRKTINLPAPGQYNEVDTSKLKKSPSKLFSFGKDKKLKDPCPLTPGPGAYNQKQDLIKKHNPQISIGKSQRHLEDFFKSIREVNPGPASYHNVISAFNKSKSTKFGRDEKLKTPKSITPGPGNYDV